MQSVSCSKPSTLLLVFVSLRSRFLEKELIDLRQKLGMPDPRAGLKECELCDSADFRPGVVCAAPAKNDAAASEPRDPQIEEIVAKITEQMLKQLNAK